MVNKRPAAALTEGAVHAHGAEGAMSLEEKMKKIKDTQDQLLCFNMRLGYINIHTTVCCDLLLLVSTLTSGP
jgi:hypothetical protein